MKRALSIAALLLALVLTLTGCHGTRSLSAFTLPDAFDETKQYEVVFWAKNDTNKTQTAIYQGAIEDFEKLYPNIAVTMRLYTNYSDIYNDVITNLATGTTPDVCVTYPDHIATYLTGENTVVPLDTFWDDARYGLGGSEIRFDAPAKDEIIPEYLEEGKIGDHVYALPFMRSTEACYINKTYVEALGYEVPDVLTWDFIWAVSEAAAQKNEDGTFKLNGQKVMIPFIYKSTDNMMIQYLKQCGAPYSTDAGEVELFSDETRAFLYEIASHARTGAFSTFQISSYPANFLNAGQCVFAVDSTAGSTWMGPDAPLSDISADKIVDFEVAVRPVPQVNPDDMKMISQGPSICLFNKADTGRTLAAWLFAQYLLSDDVQISYAETEGYVPVTSRAQGSAGYQAYLSAGGADNQLHYSVKIQATRLLLDHTADTFVTPVFNGSASVRSAAGQLIEGVVKAERRKQTVDDQSIDKLYADTAALYHLDQIGADSGDARDKGGDLGPLPGTARALLTGLLLIWLAMGAYLLAGAISRKRNAKSMKSD